MEVQNPDSDATGYKEPEYALIEKLHGWVCTKCSLFFTNRNAADTHVWEKHQA